MEPDPIWSKEPDIEAIQRIAQACLRATGAERQVSVSFLAEGTFNKAYIITVTDDLRSFRFIFRVALPIYPHYKTSSEVGTVSYIRKHTNCTVPIPQVYFYDSSSDNELGFEWIMMDFIEGVRLGQVWGKLEMEHMPRWLKLLEILQDL
ncbi:hypothetical protein BJ508DRAFT_418581 [Ascobolus immersus RN42]|uniref:Uncharacterized protein n=1 Tax=Ascobolus immersus RN42 TaxID=1160509 RepID=A0A3N4HNP3_ASCIM|nr:hypothetical protein BJ508DRAFT_418581 [Ascobolus immersus RN42]